ncbi:hypothetical protein DPEC_G00071340 [Dallia pectoralis]|uniref:Uncharacterized protein n=1 Tax=Dallia pectoralis TaxID=75939 RepID=A0ACC2H321_DALPE|nr:hypothetical protein DPEC_G00071340 [Dallia pectoralis]
MSRTPAHPQRTMNFAKASSYKHTNLACVPCLSVIPVSLLFFLARWEYLCYSVLVTHSVRVIVGLAKAPTILERPPT